MGTEPGGKQPSSGCVAITAAERKEVGTACKLIDRRLNFGTQRRSGRIAGWEGGYVRVCDCWSSGTRVFEGKSGIVPTVIMGTYL
jgi:hypothetical protein